MYMYMLTTTFVESISWTFPCFCFISKMVPFLTVGHNYNINTQEAGDLGQGEFNLSHTRRVIDIDPSPLPR